jgi:hypothetical protein
MLTPEQSKEFEALYASGLLEDKPRITMTKANLLKLRQADRIREKEKKSANTLEQTHT